MQLPARIGKYELQEFIGGGMARVYKAQDTVIGRIVAVKILTEEGCADPDAIPIHDWQKEELARRKANLMKNPASGLRWEEVKRRVRSRHGR